MSDSDMQEVIQVTSTSIHTADVTPIILGITDRIRLSFVPQLVENHKSPEKCVSGKLIYEQKLKRDEEYPTDNVSRGSIKAGEYMVIPLRTSETYELYKGLKAFYSLFEEIGQIPMGETTFTPIDRSIKNALEAIKTDPSLMRNIANKDVLGMVQQLLRVIITADTTEGLLEVLSSLEAEGIDKLTNVVNIEKLTRIQKDIAENIDNPDEEFWQYVFKENAWILSQIFATPMTIMKDKAYVGGKTIDNSGGHMCDFIYANDISRNVALIEIKTPCTAIIGREYRNNIFSMSVDFSGAVSQVLTYRDSLMQEYNSLCKESEYRVLNPIGVIIIGKLQGLSSTELSSFELFRNNLGGLLVITYDELLERIDKLISVFSNAASTDLEPMEIDLEDENLPF